jgi:hypothetical protein
MISFANGSKSASEYGSAGGIGCPNIFFEQEA